MKRKLIIITSIISAILVLGFCLFLLVLRPNIVNSILSKAEIYMDQKDYINAKKEISFALSLHSENLDAHVLNYRLLLITGNEEEILEFSKNAYSKTKNQFFKNLSRDYEKESDFPRLNFESGNYAEEFIVKIINQKDGEEIYYVKNGVRGIYRGEIHIPKGRTQLLLSREGEKGGKEYIFFVGDAAEKATLSHESGIYDAPFYLNITSEGEVFYTLDGLSPTDKSEKFITPIKIEKTTILKYFVKTKDGSSATFTKYYIFNDNKMQQHPLSKIGDYYINSSKGFRIYNGSQIIGALSATDLCDHGENLYFISPDFKKGIYKISKEGGLSKLLISGNISSLKNIGPVLFYIKDNSLYLCDENGKNETLLFETISQYVIKNKDLYFLRDGILYRASLFEDEITEIKKDVTSFDVFPDGNIYYLSKDKKLFNGENKLGENISSFALSPYEEKIAFLSENVLYYNGERIENGHIYSPSFSGNSLCYYLINEKGEHIKEIPLD